MPALVCPISEFRVRIRELVNYVEFNHGSVLLTRHGHIVATIAVAQASKNKRTRVYRSFSKVRRKARCTACKPKAKRRYRRRK